MPITLKAARVNKNLSQEKAAQKLGISKYTLSNYERGLSSPDVDILKKIEELYEIEYKEIIFFTNKLRFNRKKGGNDCV